MRAVAHDEPIRQLRRLRRKAERDARAPVVGHQDNLTRSVLPIHPADIHILQFADELRHGLEHGRRIELVQTVAPSISRKVDGDERGIAQFVRGELVSPKRPGVGEAMDEDHKVRGEGLVGGFADHVVEAHVLLDKAEPVLEPGERFFVEGPELITLYRPISHVPRSEI